MPRTNLAPVTITRAGVSPGSETAGDASNGNSISNDGRMVVLVHNNDGSNPHNVTFKTVGTVDGQAIADRVVAMAASSSKWFGPFPPEVYGSSLQVDVADANLKLTAYQI